MKLKLIAKNQKTAKTGLHKGFEEGRAAEGSYDSVTFSKQRRKLNVPALIDKGAIYITEPHGEEGWEPNSYGFSLITYYNVWQGGWASEAEEHLKPSEYDKAAKLINAPVTGSNHLVYDGKYNQILWSIKKLNIPDNIAFLDKNQKTAKADIHKGSEEGGAETSWGKGDCFEIAGRAMIHPKTRGLKLVHAYVSGQGKLEGQRFPHAWNEVGDEVRDNSNGRNIVLPKEQYYNLGKVVEKPGEYAVYNHIEAIEKMLDNKDFGPWDLNESE